MQLHFHSCGHGFPLVILHGLLGSAGNWQPLAKRFAESFRVLAMDLRNHGGSSHDDSMSLDALAGDVAETLRSQAIERAHVLGHSLGGKVAMQLALTLPETITKLLVVDIAPRAYPLQHQTLLDALAALELEKYSTRSQVEAALAPSIPDLGMRRFLLKNLTHDGRRLRWRIHLAAIRKNYPALTRGIEATGDYPNPALFIRGARSEYLIKSDEAMIQRCFPRAQIHSIAGAGHWVHAEAPEAFFSVARDFLRA